MRQQEGTNLMEEINNRRFVDEAVPVDGREFTSCKFSSATLVYSGGELPTFTACEFVDTSLQFEGVAANTLKFLSELPGNGFPLAVENIVRRIRTGKS